jgi:hypothetical protein
MNHIAKNLGAIGNALSGSSTKVNIKARLLNSFAGKESKTKWVRLWLHQVEVYMEIQHFKIDEERIHFVQTLLKEHTWEWWMS